MGGIKVKIRDSSKFLSSMCGTNVFVSGECSHSCMIYFCSLLALTYQYILNFDKYQLQSCMSEFDDEAIIY